MAWQNLLANSAGRMREGAGKIEDEETRRYQEGLGTLQGAYQDSKGILSQGVDANLLFSQAADTVGARSKSMIEGLRGSLGARGLNPNSGAAQGMLSRLAMSMQGDLIGAKRDIAIENQRQRQVNAAVNFANALNLAAYTQSPVSGAKFEADQSIFEGLLGVYGVNKQAESIADANKKNLLGGVIGGGLSILGGAL